MSRELTSEMHTALAAESVYPALFYEGEFANGTLRLWTGVGQIVWEGETWTGGDQMLQVSPLGENAELRAEGFEVTLTGMPSDNIALALQHLRQGKRGRLWLVAMSSAGVVLGSYALQEGKLDVAPIRDDGQTCTIAVRYESVLIDLDTPRDRRYTHEDLQIDHPGDLGFEFVPKLQDAQIIWGGAGAAASPIATPPLNTNAR